jgi:hypothetical protein
MRIGFDLDKIFINTPPFVPISIINKFYKQQDNGVLLYRIPSRPEQLFRSATHTPMLRQPMKTNLAFLKKLADQNKHQLFLISSRFKFLKPQTEQLVKKNGLDKIFDKLYFNYDNKQPHEFKNEVLKKLNLDIFVDDDLSLLRYVAKDNPGTKFFLFDQYSKSAILGKNITAINKLSQII